MDACGGKGAQPACLVGHISDQSGKFILANRLSHKHMNVPWYNDKLPDWESIF